MTLEPIVSLEALPAATEPLFAANPGLFNNRGWWRNVQAFGMPRDCEPLFLLCRLGGTPAAVFPLCRSASGGLSGLTTPYTCLYQPLLAAGLDAAAQRAVFTAFARYCRRSAYTRFDALDADWPGLAAWTSCARAAGLAVLRFDCFGNWHESVGGMDWRAYLASRPGALRETIRRRMRRIERDNQASLQILQDTQGLDAGIAAYEQVYARSWKVSEPFPHFNTGLIREGAEAGWLRLGVLRLGSQPVAVQLWTVERGLAIVHKLAHDESLKALSPGTVLTAWMLRYLLDQEHVTEIDFGRGDDPYKQGWASWRRQRIGIVLVNPLRPDGLRALARHGLGRMRATVRLALARN